MNTRFFVFFILLFSLFFEASGGKALSSNVDEKSNTIQVLKEVNSLKEIFDRFQGRVIYVDIWATFYQSCIDEFKFNTELAPFFKQNGIVPLYISMDGQRQNEKWKETIQKYQLHGYHLSMGTNGDIGKDILNLFTDDNGKIELSIPRYLIVDRNGEIVVRRAYSPREGPKLKEQLLQYLK